MTAMADKYTGPDVVYDAALAHQLIAELWHDTGHPSLNGGVQRYTLDLIEEVLRWPEEQLPQPARDGIAQGLLAYIQAGGAEWGPTHQARTASLLMRAAPEDPEAHELGEHLLEDALGWVMAIDSEPLHRGVMRVCASHWGEEVQWRAYQIAIRSGLPPLDSWPESYQKALVALRAVLESDGSVRQPVGLLERLRDAERAASVKQEDDRLNDDLVCRLLIVYRTLLDRRPRIAFRTSAYIENQLLTLHTKGRLRTDRHWDLWTQAVKALESERLSKRFQRYLRARADKKDLPAGEVKALEQLRPLLAE